MWQKTKQLLIAHRGYCAIAPENTRLAFETAYLFGFDGVEFDLHQTLDEQLVIIHDEDTYRTTFNKKNIETSTLTTLKEDDYGAFFKIKVPKQTILTLKEFFNLFLDKFNCINVEIKTDKVNYKGIEKKIHQIMEKYPEKKGKIIFSSFNLQSLERMFQLSDQYQLGYLWSSHNIFKKISPERIKRVCKFLHPEQKIYEKFKNEYLEFNLPFNLWTIKTKTQFNHFLNDPNIAMQISNYKF